MQNKELKKSKDYILINKKENNELSKFEEQILSYLKELEMNLMEKINNKNAEISEHLNNFQQTINNVIENNESVKETLVNHQIYKSKLTEFESFKNKADDILISHEVRLQTNISDIDSLKNKYAKIITENLLVPGYIGVSCPYKNLAEYIIYSIVELNKMKTDKDDRKKDIKDLKFRLENIMKSMVNLNDGSIERCKDYTNNIQKDIISYIEYKLKEFEDKIFEIKTEVYKFNSINEQKILEINQKVLDTYKELNEMLNEKIDNIKSNHLVLKEKIDENLNNIQKNTQDIQSFNNNINEINLNLKDNISNLKNMILSLNNNIQIIQNAQQSTQGKSSNPSSPSKFIKKNLAKNDYKIVNSKSNKKNIEKNYFGENNFNGKNTIGSESLKYNNIQKRALSKKKINEFSLEKNINENDDEDNEENTDINKDNDYNDNNYKTNKRQYALYSSIDSSIENQKNKNNNYFYRHTSSNKLKIYSNDQSFKIKNSSNKYLNKNYIREAIKAKSRSPYKEEKSFRKKEKEIIQRYKTKESNRNIKSQKIMSPINSQIYNKNNNNKSKKETEYNQSIKINPKEKEDLIKIKYEKNNKKLKLNYDLINDIHKNKILDLYSFSTSPPDGKINLNYWTITDKLTQTFLEKQKKYEIEKETGVNLRLVQIDMNNSNKNIIKNNNNSQNNINKKNIFPIMKNNFNSISNEKIKSHNIKNMKRTFVNTNNNNIIKNLRSKLDYGFNKTFYDKNKNHIYSENFKLRNTMKELKINDNKHCLTYK